MSAETTGMDVIAEALDNPAPAPSFAAPGDVGPDSARDGYERPTLDAGCPVKPLGIRSDISGSQTCYYLDTNGQLVGLEAGNRHGKNSLIALFGPKSDWLESHYPQWSKPVTEYDRSTKTHTIIKPSQIIGFDQAEASRALIEECMRRGIFDPTGKMRGRGAHQTREGGLVLHYGDKILATQHRTDGSIKGWQWLEPGRHDGFVYPRGPSMPRPLAEDASTKPAIKLNRLVSSWNWKRPLLDPRLLLGWIGAAMVGGALPWRPNIWITGARGTGKSTLNGEDGVLDRIFGDGLMKTGNASAAAIRQTLKNSTIPVVFDEIEASADNRRVTEVVELARVSSSGAKIYRGGQDHQAQEFTLRSCFQFSSINIPPMEPQDRSRLGILELKPFAPGSIPPDLEDYHLPLLGKHLMRRMIDGWSRFRATLKRYQRALASAGHDNRACDQFGTLLACADLLINDDLPDDEELAHWVGLCDRHQMVEIADATSDNRACMDHILTSLAQARGGDEREALATWIGRAVSAAANPDSMDRSAERLQQIGLKVVNARYHPAADGKPARWGAAEYMPGEPGYLAVAGHGQGLSAIFAGTKWQGGVWRQSLARTEGCIEPVKIKFGKSSLTGVLVPLAAVLDESELPKASLPAAVAEWRAKQGGGAA